jgi:hypothetical protein
MFVCNHPQDRACSCRHHGRARTITTRTGKIEITSLVTQIATHLGVLVGAQVTYLETPSETFGEDHFVKAHLLKHVDGELVMLYPHSFLPPSSSYVQNLVYT